MYRVSKKKGKGNCAGGLESKKTQLNEDDVLIFLGIE